MLYRIYNPVFTNPGSAVFEKLDAIIVFWIGWRCNLNNPVRRTCTSLIIQFIPVTDNRNVRLNIVSVIFIQENSKWCGID